MWATVWQKNKKIEASDHLAGLQNCESYIDWTHSWCSMNQSVLVKKAWLRPFITILSPHCNVVWFTYRYAEIYTVLLKDLDYFWRQNSHIQKTNNCDLQLKFSSSCLPAKLNWPWECYISSSTCFSFSYSNILNYLTHF